MRSSLIWFTLLVAVGCNGDGETKPGCEEWYADVDGDGFGNPDAPTEVCSPADQAGLVENGDDCNDANGAINPNATETCDFAGVDEDCDGLINDDDDVVIGGVDTWLDADGDGYGDPGSDALVRCEVGGDRADNAEDCDDTDAATFPGAAYLEDLTACTTDADGDGWGSDSPPGVAIPGLDCNDTNPDSYPDATEWLGDDVDQDCDGEAEWFLFDDFETGAVDPEVWAARGAGQSMTQDYAHSGTWSVDMGGDGFMTSGTFDTSLCENMTWSYWGKRGPDNPESTDTLALQFNDGSGWVLVDAWAGGSDPDFVLRSGAIELPSAYHPDFRIRLISDATNGIDNFYVDDFRLSCPGPDGDGDGIGVNDDCDDTDADHWFDCGLCADADGDGRGIDCDLGPDCDDADDTVFPGAPDLPGDGIDSDCNGFDGAGVVDDFELGSVDPVIWSSITGDYSYDGTYAVSGSYSLNLGGGGAVAESQPFDASVCSTIVYTLAVQRGPEVPDAGDDLVLRYDDGTTWVEALRIAGDGTTDPDFITYQGTIADPAALWSGFRIQFESNGSGSGTDDFFIDDLSVACGQGDVDGDGVDGSFDCDDNDPNHWSDCGLCVDADGDNFGLDCDLGPDCNDADNTIFPGQPDLFQDGVDNDCNGVDGPGIADGFETGAVDPFVWASITGDYSYDAVNVASGTYSLNLGGGGGLAESQVFDASVCSSLVYTMAVKRGPDTPELGDDLVLRYDDGTAWAEALRVPGIGSTDPDFITYQGTIVDPAALWSGFRIQLESNGVSSSDDFFIDDLAVGCGQGDVDGDGVDGNFDCDDNDPNHWSDCGLCVDADGDNFGLDCDLGPDCNDADNTIFPGQPDLFQDGVDNDCNGVDGPGIADGFEAGAVDPFIWASITGDYSYDTVNVASGTYSISLGGGGAVAESLPFDASVCSSLVYTLEIKRGPEVPDAGDDLVLRYDDGTTWVEALRIAGDGTTDPDFITYDGTIADPAALWSGFRIQFESNGSGSGTDDFFIDDLAVGCGQGDVDGDGFDGAFDCDDNDPNHWSDCGLCVDADGDNFGLDCDLGPDCNDADNTIFPGQPDLFQDGVDNDCNGVDGPGIADGFEAGAVDPFIWASITGDYSYDTVNVASGSYSLNLGGGGGLAESLSFDASVCSTVVYSLAVKRGPDTPELNDDLVLRYDDGVAWVEALRVPGIGATDPAFLTYQGTIVDPAALHSSFRIQLESNGLSSSDDFFIDDLAVGCGQGDADGDGVDGNFDCDDGDAAHWSDCGLCVDVDGDGFGLDCDLGFDCDDNDATFFPGAADPIGDGLDTDCSGIDGPGVFDDFELGVPAPWWSSMTGDYSYDTTQVFAGTYSLKLAGTSAAETIALNTTTCPSVLWSFMGRRGDNPPETNEDLIISWFDGTTWIEVDRWLGDGTIDPAFVNRAGAILDPAALSVGFQLRIEADTTATTDEFLIDDLIVDCGQGDSDGDGIDDLLDCDSADPNHWSDCGLCVDADGDDFGLDCDLGPDCDDADNTVFPGAEDLPGDGIDADCSGVDGVGMFDDFELGAPGVIWAIATGDYEYDVSYATSGLYSLELGGGGATFTSIPSDFSSCSSIVWSYEAKRGPEVPDAGDDLVLSYDDGFGWVEFDVLEGDGVTDPDFVLYQGTIVDPAALWSGFRIQLQSNGSGSNTDDFFVDDLEVVCGQGDNDGDGIDGTFDCDDGDPNHWFDCGLCVDVDGDDFGLDCDLGPDCDDNDNTVFPGQPDLVLDGVDNDCNGIDGPGIADGFETGAVDPFVWASITGDYSYDTVNVASGTYSLSLGGGGGIAESLPFDASICSSLVYTLEVKRGPETPDAGDDLVLRYDDGVAWVEALRVPGIGSTDPDFITYQGTIVDPAALWSGFRIQLESNGLSSSDDFYVDDLAVGCGQGDNDGDGIDGAFDCDDGDPWHWSDCGACVDVDGDDFGLDCDLGPDCDDGNATVFPGQPDLLLDGVDNDCNGIDGAGITDDFETGTIDPAVWSSITGDYSYDSANVLYGGYSLSLGGGGGIAESQVLNTSFCSSVTYSLWVKRGPETPDAGDDLVLRYDNGIAWVEALRVLGVGTTDPDFILYQGVINDPAAQWVGFRIQLESNGLASSDDFYVDDLAVGCTP